MNSTILFPPTRPVLKLSRAAGSTPPVPRATVAEGRWAATLAEERRRLHEDQEALRVREINLREYEARLRLLQAEIEAGTAAGGRAGRGSAAPFVRPSSRVPFEGDTALQASWEKLHRARELLEAEQNHLRDERIQRADWESNLKSREDAVAEREERVAERERLLAEAVGSNDAAQPVAGEHTLSAVARLTTGPFAMARAVFGGKK